MQLQALVHLAQIAMNSVQEVAVQVDRDYRQSFSRGYGVVEPLLIDDAEVVIVTAGSITSTARLAVRNLREQGLKAGLLKLRLFRPFPVDAVQSALAGKKKIAVLDRNHSLGCGGIFCQELRAALVHSPDHPQVFSYIAGMGGTDVTPEVIQKIARDTMEATLPAQSSIWIRDE